MDLEIQRLLLDCGFKAAPPPVAARWAVAGELDGGLSLHVSCMTGARGGFVLLVQSETERQLLVDMLAQNSVHAVDVRAERMEPAAKATWLALGVGVGALALFGWVLTSIRPFFP
ncbi:MAG: hypothetical protein JWN44_6415 [Myxococcales bacterium]|nr:hypothetical protein [Myxococcales bacterium]